MKLERGKNSARNVVYGTVSGIYSLIVPFFIRAAIIRWLGIQYIGLDSLFASVLSVLNLAELGVGYALVFSMYEPLANDDTDKICALLLLYKKYYRIIGLVVLCLGVVLTPFLPHLIKDTIPTDVNLYVLYYIHLGVTVISYWALAYKGSIITVYQRNDISSKVNIIVNTIKYIIQFVLLWLLHNYYYYIIVLLVSGIVSNLIIAAIVNTKYPQYKATGNLSKEETKKINQRVRDLFTSRIGGVVVDSADAIVISAFLGLTMLARYQNYYYVITTIMSFVSLLIASSLAGIGNSLITETRKKNFFDFKRLTLLFCWIGTVSVCVLLCIYQLFMELWVGKENVLPFSMVVCFCVYLFIKIINTLLNVYKDAAGIWHQDRFRPLVTAITNLMLNLIMVRIWGLYGVLLSTIISMLFVGMPWLLHNLFTQIFNENIKQYLLVLVKYNIVAVVLAMICMFVSRIINFDKLILTILVRGVVVTILSNSIMMILFRTTREYKSLMKYFDRLTKERFRFIIKNTKVKND